MPAILVGRRKDNGWRDQLWGFCRKRWEEQLGWPISEGHHDDGPFSLSKASNRAADCFWDVALYVGADWILRDAESARDAVSLALHKQQLVFAHKTTVVLGEEATRDLLAGADAAAVMKTGEAHHNTFSGVLAVPRTLWDAVGGFDERFVGWGWDDLAFWSACATVGGGFQRVNGKIAHLWHPRPRDQREENPYHAANQVLGQRYLDAKFNKQRMRAILNERSTQ